jgi:hypothetical protein
MITAAAIQTIEKGWLFSPGSIQFLNRSSCAALMIVSVAAFAFHAYCAKQSMSQLCCIWLCIVTVISWGLRIPL